MPHRSLLPRLALLYKNSNLVTARQSGGLACRAPVPNVDSLDERDYPLMQPLRNVSNPVFSELWAPVEGHVINPLRTWRWVKS